MILTEDVRQQELYRNELNQRRPRSILAVYIQGNQRQGQVLSLRPNSNVSNGIIVFPTSSLSQCQTINDTVDSGQAWHLPDSMNFSTHLTSYDDRKFWGWFFVSIGSVFFIGYLFIAVISKLLPPSNIAVISAMQNDWYYCFLVPLSLPIVVVAVYFHWLSMKMFKHA